MDDKEIVRLFEQRSETAITETTQKYGTLCRRIAMQILGNTHDAEECIDDMLVRVWNAIPPAHPLPLAPYLTTVLRRICFDRYDAEKTEKRGSGQTAVAADELSEVLADKENVEVTVDTKALRAAINRFLGELPKESRVMFLERYYLLERFSEIAKTHHIGLSKAKMMVFRTRDKLKAYLEQEGYL